MTVRHRLRRAAPYLAMAALAMATVACAATGKYPNTTFEPKTDLGRAIDFLWDRLLLLGTIVFVLTEGALLFIVWKYRARPGAPEPKHIHGSTKLEILWTLIPAVVLVFIAVPTVRVIFETQGRPPANALKVQVIGHQWWWEFKYPELGLTTANELYLPSGEPIHFTLETKDVLHSFWIPQLGAKRDLISNRTNHIYFTSDSTGAEGVWNGFCTEYCGASHSNMHFRVYTVPRADFDRWVAWQKSPAVMSSAPAPAGPASPDTAQSAARSAQPAVPYAYPRERLPIFTIPTSPLPRNVRFAANLVGDPARGQQLFRVSACIGCHAITGVPGAVSQLGPNLTHVGTRYTIAAGMYPNDTRHLSLWIKNAPALKPGSIMPALGKGEYNPIIKARVTTGGLDDQQIADIVAYLQALK